MAHILVIYHSQSGNTQKLAEAVASGAASVEDTKVVLKQAKDATIEDLVLCDGIAIGSPEYFGYMAGMIKDFFDRTYEPAKAKRAIFMKPYIIFISAGNDGRKARDQIERICLGYPFKKAYEPLIVRGTPDKESLKQCHEMGQTIAAGCDLGIY
ncbi:flavodoxin family protein [Thermodesulfobacteriota bacterium]